MSRKSIRILKEKKPKFDPSKYKGEQFGPFILEQYGRYFSMRSILTDQERAEHLETIKAKQPEFKAEINKKIEELIKIVEEYDPLELISAIAPENIFGNPETIKESTFEGKECYVEYAISLALSVENPKIENHATKEAIDRFRELIAEIFNDTFWYFATDNLDDEENRREIRHKSLGYYLMVRGDSYAEHHIDLVRNIFEIHDEFFNKNYGFVTADLISWLEAIENQGIDALKRFIAFSRQLDDTHKRFVQFLDEHETDDIVSMQELVAKFDQIASVKSGKAKLMAAYENIDENIFEIKPNEGLPLKFLEVVSARFGENSKFATFEKSPGWVTNDSIISRRPIILYDKRYYCFGIQLLYRNIIFILESLIKEKDEKYFRTKYQFARGTLLATKALQYMKTLLPDAKIYPNLFYSVNSERYETDAIIIFDSFLFIFEAKGGALTPSAKRGSLDRIKRNVGDLIDDAYIQAVRTKKFIAENEKPRFEYEDGTEALVLDDKKLHKNIYLVNVTLDNLGQLATHLPSLKKLELLQGDEWIWSIFINDLRIISEIVEMPSEFLVYLQRRLEANEHPNFEVKDELDFFLYYLKEGLYLNDDWLKNLRTFGLFSYTDDLDRYYNFKAGRVSSGEKPRLQIPEEYKEFVRQIEATTKPGFSEVTTTLLGFDVYTMEEIIKQIETAKSLSRSDLKDHDFTMIFGDSDLGLTISIASKKGVRSPTHGHSYCDLKMYQLKISKWIFLSIDIRNLPEHYYFEFIDQQWKYDANMEREVSAYRVTKLRQYFITHKKPGPNEACPCNSGLKFKKCCQAVSNSLMN